MSRMIVASCLLAACLPARGEPVRKALVIGVDGMRPDVALNSNTPHMHQLMRDGCWTDASSTGEITVSGPGWSSFLCGVWMDKHGSTDNAFRRVDYERFPHFFARLKEAKPDVRTAQFVNWAPIDRYITSTAQPDIRWVEEVDHGTDPKLIVAASEALKAQDADVWFIYFADVDNAGHAFGFHPSVPEYVAQVEKTDEYIGRLLEAMKARPTFADEEWLILLSSDHSGTIDGKHGRNEPDHRRILFIASGAATARGKIEYTVNQVDIPPTVLRYLGVTVNKEWDWDGRAVGFPVKTEYGTNLLYNGDAEAASGRDSCAVNVGAPGWTDWGAMTVIQYGSSQFPASASIGPSDRGANFFCGGSTKAGAAPTAEMSQRIDIADIGADIDAGGVTFELSAWLGGFATQKDLAWVEARFLDEHDGLLSASRVSPVSLEDRKREIGGSELGLTGLLRRATSGNVPKGARRVEVRLAAEAASGDNDGYADDISIVLRRVK